MTPAGQQRVGWGRAKARAAGALLALLLAAAPARAAITVLDTYYSPRNRERPLRSATSFIILHTTEGSSKGALEKLRARGEAHFLIDESGRIYRLIDQRRVAYHCGRSMWNGRSSLDLCSVGIEMAGYHSRAITAAQTRSLAGLIAELQRIYKVPDDRVLPHCMVAYGAPNQWHRRSHRGRKRCGMRFATTALRKQLGLTSKPRRDPDVDARRLVVADPYLERVLYGGSAQEEDRAVATYDAADSNVIMPGRSAWDVARDAYNSGETVYVLPDGTRKSGREISNWRSLPSGTRVLLGGGDTNPPERVQTVGAEGATAGTLAGEEGRSDKTLYLLQDGRCLRGSQLSDEQAAKLPEGTRVLVGYKLEGPVTARRRAFDICGPRWQDPDTYFLFPDGSLVAGNTVDAGRIPRRTMVIYKE